MEIIKSIKLRQLRKERETIKANRKAWINLHKASTIDASISRTFLAYQSAINRGFTTHENINKIHQTLGKMVKLFISRIKMCCKGK